MLKDIPVAWSHEIPYGLLHAPNPSPAVRKLLDVLTQLDNVNNL